eukprot:scaffold111955_cov36-Tisochrysis_lutea.AAC.1
MGSKSPGLGRACCAGIAASSASVTLAEPMAQHAPLPSPAAAALAEIDNLLVHQGRGERASTGDHKPSPVTH